MKNLDSILKSRDITNKDPSSQSYGFSSSHVWMWELDHKESWGLKKWCFWTVVLEKTLECPLDWGNQSWIVIGRTDSEAEGVWTLTHWKRPWCGKDWRQKEKGMTEDEIVGRHHRLNGHEFEQALGVGDGQGSLACHSPWGHKESDTTEWLNWTDRHLNWTLPDDFDAGNLQKNANLHSTTIMEKII